MKNASKFVNRISQLVPRRRQSAALSNGRKFGTFDGVFLPTLLTIMGAVMYLRTGWVVGNAGLGGAILIILLANFITICTALSISSIATNIRVKAQPIRPA
jgi:solute carrier family 12 sodium/potassium/chloride transporter 2